jgi:hypothetical protein
VYVVVISEDRFSRSRAVAASQGRKHYCTVRITERTSNLDFKKPVIYRRFSNILRKFANSRKIYIVKILILKSQETELFLKYVNFFHYHRNLGFILPTTSPINFRQTLQLQFSLHFTPLCCNKQNTSTLVCVSRTRHCLLSK